VNIEHIFWLKKDDKYYLKFVDPHGIQEGRDNSVDKIEGFNDFIEDIKTIKKQKNIFAELYFYNEKQPGVGMPKEYIKTWTNDFTKIFSI
jgi:hypothetical protein